MRLMQLDGVSRNEILDGRKPPDLPMFNVVAGRANMPLNETPGADGAPHEIFRALPYYMVYKIWHSFSLR